MEKEYNETQYNEVDPEKWYNNCIAELKTLIPEEKRRQLAADYGPNWACIISGFGDQ